MGPACQELLNALLTADLQLFRQADQDPCVGAAAFLLNGGMAGSKRRAEDRMAALLRLLNGLKGQPYGTTDEAIARVVLRKMDARRKAGPA